MKACPECESKLYEYFDKRWIVLICWKCGHYESNSEAYRTDPDYYENLVRENPVHFMRKFGSSTEKKHIEDSTDNETEPFFGNSLLRVLSMC